MLAKEMETWMLNNQVHAGINLELVAKSTSEYLFCVRKDSDKFRQEALGSSQFR